MPPRSRRSIRRSRPKPIACAPDARRSRRGRAARRRRLRTRHRHAARSWNAKTADFCAPSRRVKPSPVSQERVAAPAPPPAPDRGTNRRRSRSSVRRSGDTCRAILCSPSAALAATSVTAAMDDGARTAASACGGRRRSRRTTRAWSAARDVLAVARIRRAATGNAGARARSDACSRRISRRGCRAPPAKNPRTSSTARSPHQDDRGDGAAI